MSEKSSSSKKLALHHRVRARLKRTGEKRTYRWRMAILFPAWITVAYVMSNLIVVALLWILDILHMPADTFLRPAILQTAIATLIYLLTIAIVVAVPYTVKRLPMASLGTLGLTRLISWSDIGLAPVVFLFYTVASSAVLAILVSLFPGFPADQTQDVGFQAFGSQADNLLAFVTLVVIAPIAEETLFRGYLYGKLGKYIPTVVAALITSLLFGVAHLQWNVGIDVFVMSLFLCGLRSLTGSIWAGVLVHMIKNGIAFYILFIAPMVGG